MKISEHANYLLNEYGRLQFDYAAYYKPYGESLRNEARNNLEEYIAELEAEVTRLLTERDDAIMAEARYIAKVELAKKDARIAELEEEPRWIPVSERLPDGGHREFYEVACIHQVFGELALFSKGRWVIYEGENVYDVTKQVKFWRNRQHLPDEVIAVISKGEMKPEVQE